MSANSRQVGGNHYDAELKHWDWVPAIGMQYTEGCASKHLQRYDKKNEAVEDLEKSIHYIEKTMELAPLLIARLAFVRPAPDFIFEATMRFCDANGVNGAARQVMLLLSRWTTINQLRECIRLTTGLLEIEHGKAPPIKSHPVPLEDSNKHADRADGLRAKDYKRND